MTDAGLKHLMGLTQLQLSEPLAYQGDGRWSERPSAGITKSADNPLMKDRQRVGPLGLLVSFRQVCMNRFPACGIVGCQHPVFWRTADGYQRDTRPSCRAGWHSTAI